VKIEIRDQFFKYKSLCLQISLEYIELLHVMEKVSLLHIGDPDFKKQFSAEAKESKVITILHSTLVNF